jgi:hypothetical protein
MREKPWKWKPLSPWHTDPYYNFQLHCDSTKDVSKISNLLTKSRVQYRVLEEVPVSIIDVREQPSKRVVGVIVRLQRLRSVSRCCTTHFECFVRAASIRCGQNLEKKYNLTFG